MKKILVFALFPLSAIAQNPAVLKNLTPGSGNSVVTEIVKTSGYTFFGNDTSLGTTHHNLYRTDGTTAGTIKLNLVYPTYNSTDATLLTPFGNKIVFAGDNTIGYGEIWSSDGTQAGTVAIERFSPTTYKPIHDLEAFNGFVYYDAEDPINHHQLLKRTDGTLASTSVIYDFGVSTGGEISLMKQVGPYLYFNNYRATDQLWRTDGTTVGTIMLHDFGANGGVCSNIMDANGKASVFNANFNNNTTELWMSDGSIVGTAVNTAFNAPYNTGMLYPSNVLLGGFMYFTANDGTNGAELWKTNGTTTSLLADINSGAGASTPNYLTVLNGDIYFAATEPTAGNELRKLTVATGVVSLLKDINPGTTSSNPYRIVKAGNNLIFRAIRGTATGNELFYSDGTAANTFEIANINPATNASSNPNYLTPEYPVYFTANNGTDGIEVIKYDAPDNIWVGGSNTNSTSGSNWLTGIVPTASDNVVIASGSANPCNLSANFICKDLSVFNQLNMGANSISVSGNFQVPANPSYPFAMTATGGIITMNNTSTKTVDVKGNLSGVQFTVAPNSQVNIISLSLLQ